MKDNINPNHYKTRKHECIEFTRLLNFNLGNAFKCIWRFEHKNGKEDLEKAVWYLKDQIRNRPGMSKLSQPKYDKMKFSLEWCGFERNHLSALNCILYAAYVKNYDVMILAISYVEKLIEEKYGKGNEK